MARKPKAASTVANEIRALNAVRRHYRDDEFIVDQVIAALCALDWQSGETADRPSVCWRERAERHRASLARFRGADSPAGGDRSTGVAYGL